MARRTYTAAEKAEALALYAEVGCNEAARRLGINAGTLASWAHRSGAASVAMQERPARIEAARQRWEERRTALVHEMGEVAELALERTRRAVKAGEVHEAKALATTMAILVDKAQLLSGAATSRSELAHHARDHVIADARDRALRLVG